MKKLLGFLLMFLVMVMLSGMATASTSSPVGLTTDITHQDPTDIGPAMAAVVYACLECQKEVLMRTPIGTLSLTDNEKGASISPLHLLAGLHNPGQTYLPDIVG